MNKANRNYYFFLAGRVLSMNRRTPLLKLFVLNIFVISTCFPALAETNAKNLELTVYIAPGLDKPIAELAKIYRDNNKINIILKNGEITRETIKNASKSGDIIIVGAEYQLNQIIKAHPSLIDLSSRSSLPSRATGVLVRKRSSNRISSFSDLGKQGYKVMVVDAEDQTGLWEDMTAKRDSITKINANIAYSASSNSDAIKQWNTRKDLDAWITFQSWHYYTQDSTRLIKVLDHYKRFRGSPLAVIKTSSNKIEAKKFIDFLKSKQNLEIYKKWGW